MANVVDDDFLRAGLAHLAVQHGAKVLATRGEMSAGSIDWNAIHDERHVAEHLVVHQTAHLAQECGWRDREVLEAILVEVVQDLLAIVPSKDVQRIAVHLRNQRRSAGGHVALQQHGRPRLRLEVILMHVVEPLGAIVAPEGEEFPAIDRTGVKVSLRRWLAQAGEPRPLIAYQVAAEEIIHALHTIVPTKHVDVAVDGVPLRSGWGREKRRENVRQLISLLGAVAWCTHQAGHDRAVGIAPSAHIFSHFCESVLVDCGHIAKASRRRVIHGLHSTPGLAPEVELIEVIEPRRAVVSAKEVQLALVLHDTVVLSHARAFASRLDAVPHAHCEVELAEMQPNQDVSDAFSFPVCQSKGHAGCGGYLVEVIQSAIAAIASEHVQFPVDDC
eukprot:scaffold1941_cov263-Pinguiococcus_pyrenoidosus.AAC.17